MEKNLKRKVPCTTATHFHHAEALTEKVGNTLGNRFVVGPLCKCQSLDCIMEKRVESDNLHKLFYFFSFFYLSMTVFCILGLSYAHLLLDYYNYAIKQWIFKFLYKIRGTGWTTLRTRLDFLIYFFYLSSKKFKNLLSIK